MFSPDVHQCRPSRAECNESLPGLGQACTRVPLYTSHLTVHGSIHCYCVAAAGANVADSLKLHEEAVFSGTSLCVSIPCSSAI